MLRLDFYVQHLLRREASALELRSGAPVRFVHPEGTVESNKPIGHDQVHRLVREAAPQQVLQQLQNSRAGTFTHRSDAGVTVRVSVQVPEPGVWQVRVEPASARDAEDGAQGGVATAESPAPAQSAQPARAASPAPASAIALSAAQPRGEEPRVNGYLRQMVELGASDLHLSSGAPPMVRLHGGMQALEGSEPLQNDALGALLYEILPERNRDEYETRNDTDFSHTIEGVARFRANYFCDRKGIGAVFRQIPFDIMPPEKLGLPKQVLDLCYLSKGLVLVTGPTGSGKSTTLATLIDHINRNRTDHIITIEDPIEFVHGNQQCLVNQREVGTHTGSFKTALRAALREDPDIVLVGEMRDLETIAIALETAETGHLVFGTLHTTSAIGTVDRIIDQFPADQQSQIRVMLADALRGVIAQVLCKRKGGGRAAAYEVLLSTSAAANLIREGKTFQLTSVMQTGKNAGMQTMNEHLLKLVQDGVIEPHEAYIKSYDKQGITDALQRAGVELDLGAQ